MLDIQFINLVFHTYALFQVAHSLTTGDEPFYTP